MKRDAIILVLGAIVLYLAYRWLQQRFGAPADPTSDLSLNDVAAGASSPGGIGQGLGGLPDPSAPGGGWVGRP
jgi:hypothetical protein